MKRIAKSPDKGVIIMATLARSELATRTELCLNELGAALEAENRLEVDRLVAFITRNQRITIDFLVYLRWRGIHRGDYIGNLRDNVVWTLT